MCLANAVILLLGIGSSCAAQTDTPGTAPASQVKTIAAIGQDIENLKAKFPQLREFSVGENVLSERLTITYDYHTHRGEVLGGSSRSNPWTGERRRVPEPDAVWLRIDFHDPAASTDLIHTQPMVGWPGWTPYCFEDKKVLFLFMSEDDKTSQVSGEIWEILKRHGVKPCTAPASQVKTITAIGQDIANLKAKFPQLREFSVSKNVRSKRPIIDYHYHTHPSHFRGGWAAQVPELDNDGVWFYIELHDPASRSQIDTHPGDLWPQCLKDKKLQFLILQGKKINPAAPEIWKILERHGVRPCADRTP